MENTTLTVILIATGIIFLAVLVFAFSTIRQQRKHQRFYEERIRDEITLLECERERVAADLHDQLGAMVSAVKFKLMALKEGEVPNLRILNESFTYLDRLSEQIREIANDLMPSSLVKGSVADAIRDFIANLNTDGQLKIDFSSAGDISISGEYKIHLYRIVMEIIQNCLKHSQAELLRIELQNEGEDVLLSAADNGIGIRKPDKWEIKQGSGLKNMQSRVDIMKGTMDVKSGNGSGTSFVITIPKSNDQ